MQVLTRVCGPLPLSGPVHNPLEGPSPIFAFL